MSYWMIERNDRSAPEWAALSGEQNHILSWTRDSHLATHFHSERAANARAAAIEASAFGSMYGVPMTVTEHEDGPAPPDEASEKVPWYERDVLLRLSWEGAPGLDVRLVLHDFACDDPDYPGGVGTLTIHYTPRDYILEPTTLALWLEGFRGRVVRVPVAVDAITNRLFERLDPVWLAVEAEFWTMACAPRVSDPVVAGNEASDVPRARSIQQTVRAERYGEGAPAGLSRTPTMDERREPVFLGSAISDGLHVDAYQAEGKEGADDES